MNSSSGTDSLVSLAYNSNSDDSEDDQSIIQINPPPSLFKTITIYPESTPESIRESTPEMLENKRRISTSIDDNDSKINNTKSKSKSKNLKVDRRMKPYHHRMISTSKRSYPYPYRNLKKFTNTNSNANYSSVDSFEQMLQGMMNILKFEMKMPDIDPNQYGSALPSGLCAKMDLEYQHLKEITFKFVAQCLLIFTSLTNPSQSPHHILANGDRANINCREVMIGQEIYKEYLLNQLTDKNSLLHSAFITYKYTSKYASYPNCPNDPTNVESGIKSVSGLSLYQLRKGSKLYDGFQRHPSLETPHQLLNKVLGNHQLELIHRRVYDGGNGGKYHHLYKLRQPINRFK